RFRTHPGPAAATGWQPVVSWGTPAKHDVVGLRRFANGYHVGLGLQQPNGGLMWFDTGVPIPASSVPFDLAVHVDQALRDVSATADGKFAADYPRVQEMATGPFAVGTATGPDVAPRFAGTLDPLPVGSGLCRDLADRRTG